MSASETTTVTSLYGIARFVRARRGIAIAIVFVGIGILQIPVSVHAAEVTFQLINDTQRALNLKVFSRGESKRVWPAQSKAYSLRPNEAMQQLKIDCTEGEKICWGAWATQRVVHGAITGSQRPTQTFTKQYGAGERGLREAEYACTICKDGALARVVKISAGVESTGAQ